VPRKAGIVMPAVKSGMQSNRNVRTKTIPQGHKKLEKSK
jgi:hypothetical protein